ncbi:MAG: oligosaccharide flippase family protein, partial [Dehalococcoidales bacterium]|nr:oligosaccharide flippase family protein [Dehalococcoidales bacterium]
MLNILLGIIQMPIITRGLGTNLYGIWALINVTISLMLPFAGLSLGSGIIRFLAAEKDENTVRDDFFSSFSIVFLSSGVLSTLLLLLASLLAVHIIKDVNATQYIRIASVLIILNSFSVLALSFLRMRR